jgi:5-methylcytosine-specific restriction endonuclease McrA
VRLTPLTVPNHNRCEATIMADADSKACTGCTRTLPLTSFQFRQNRGYYHTRCRECNNAVSRNRYSKDPEKEAKKQREYNAAHRDAIRATVNRSYRKHIDKRRVRDRAFGEKRRNNDELRARLNARARALREINIEKARARCREWNSRNKDKVRAAQQRVSAMRRGKLKTGVSAAELFQWKHAARKVCYWCGKKCARNHEVDHYVPLSRGGEHELSNLVIACKSCNRRKSAKDPEQFRAETWHGTLFSSLIGK